MPESTDNAKLDEISLAQALIDFEVANARVVDLTARLVEAHRRQAELANELEELRRELLVRNRQVDLLRRSGVIWLVQKARALRHAVRS